MDLIAQLLVNGIVNGSHYALLGLGFGLIFGPTRITHFAFGPLYALSAYAAWTAAVPLGLPLPLAMLAGILAGALSGVAAYRVLYRPFERRQSPSLVVLIASLGLFIVLENVIGIVFGSDTKVVPSFNADVFLVGDIVFTSVQAAQVLALLVVGSLLALFLTRSDYGKAVMAMTDNPEMARIIGIDTVKVATLAFALGSAVAAVPAVLILLKEGATPYMGFSAVFMGFVAVIVGGIGSLRGAVVGGLALGVVENIGTWQIPTEWQGTIAFVVLFLVLLFKPRGLFSRAALMDYLLHIAVMVSLYAILAASFNLLIGFAGLFALSQAAFFGIGAYATAILATRLGLAFPLPILLAILLTASVGMLVALPALRIGGDHLVIVTLALQIIVIAVMVNWRSVTGGTDGIAGIPKVALLGVPLDTPGRFLPLALAGAALCLAIAWRLAASPFARAVRAMRENEQAVQAVGKNVVAIKLTVFAFSAGLAAAAGGLYAHYISFVSAETFTLDLTIYILAMVILGGTGNLWGSVLGAVLLTALPELLKFIDLPPDIADKSRQILYGLALIAILLLRPQGLLGEISTRRRLPAALPRKAAALDDAAPADGAVTVAGQGLVRRFGGIVAVSALDIELRRGRIIGLIGPNGAGKTTAFNLLTGFVAPDEGSVRLGGVPLAGLKPHQIVRRGMARSFQDLKLFARMTVLDNVMVALPRQKGDNLLYVYFAPWIVAAEERENRARALAILDFVGLAGEAGEVAESLSYAEEKLLVIARLVATGAEVLLFDEPLSGLAPNTLEAIFPIIRRLASAGKTICIIEHNLDVIRGLCDTAVFLDEGRKLAEDAPERLIADPALAARYFG